MIFWVEAQNNILLERTGYYCENVNYYYYYYYEILQLYRCKKMEIISPYAKIYSNVINIFQFESLSTKLIDS